MAQRARIRVSTVTETKMFAKKMHRLVKKIQDKPVDSLDLLTDMARKRGENLSIPIEVETEGQWTGLLKREGLIVCDVYSGWSGPCTSMFSILRKLKLDTNDDRMILAAANADNISQLSPFRNQSEPCWLFIGGGKPVKVLRGSNAPKLVRTIKAEFQHELECIEGKAKRNLISIKFEAGRREKAVSEAIALDELMALEEKEKVAKETQPPKSPTPVPDEETEVTEKEKSPEIDAEREEHNENEQSESQNEETTEDEVDKAIDEAILERRNLMEASNMRLRDALRPYTVIAIQSYLLETGAVTEIKDHLAADFNLVRERYINLNDEDARKLFRIPLEVPDLAISFPSKEDQHSDTEANVDSIAETEFPPKSSGTSPVPNTEERHEVDKEEPDAEAHSGDEEGNDGNERSIKREKTPIRMTAVTVPDVIIGDTLILLLQCVRVKPSTTNSDGNNENDENLEDVSHDADYYIRDRTGPDDFETAATSNPNSLRAMYGKEKYVAGVWCPGTYEEKRFVMLNYFPLFVTEMLMPAIPDPPNETDDTRQEPPEEPIQKKSNSKN